MSEHPPGAPHQEHYSARNNYRDVYLEKKKRDREFMERMDSDPGLSSTVRKLGRLLTGSSERRSIQKNAGAELQAHRRDLAKTRMYGGERSVGLVGAELRRKQEVRDAKEAVRFAEKGYRRSDKRERLAQERSSARERLNTETVEARGGKTKGVGARLERLGNRMAARREAKRTVNREEIAAAAQLQDRRAELHSARNKHEYTKSVLKDAKRGAVGTRSDKEAVRHDALESQEERLAALQARAENSSRYRSLKGMDAEPTRPIEIGPAPAVEVTDTEPVSVGDDEVMRVAATAARTVVDGAAKPDNVIDLESRRPKPSAGNDNDPTQPPTAAAAA